LSIAGGNSYRGAGTQRKSLSAERVKLMNHFTTAIDMLSMRCSLPLPASAAERHPYLSLAAEAAVKLSKIDLPVFDDNPALSSLDPSSIEQLRAADSFLGKLHLNTRTKTKSVVEDNAVIAILLDIARWARAMLRMSDIINKIQALSHGRLAHSFLQLHHAHGEVQAALNVFVSQQRVHTAHNYVLREPPPPGFPREEYDSVGVMSLLHRLGTTPDTGEVQRGVIDQSLSSISSEAMYSSVLGDHQPCRWTGSWIPSGQYADRFIWWDAITCRDWKALMSMVTDMCLSEPAESLEDIVSELIICRAPSEVVLQIIRSDKWTL
jgi:hypothetical protein